MSINLITEENLVTTQADANILDVTWTPCSKTNEIIESVNTLTDGTVFTVDTISERTTASGVTIDGVTLKDNGIVQTGAVTNFIKFTGTVGTATDGTLFSTGSTWITHATAGQCAFKILTSSTATSGDYAAMRVRGRADAVSSGGVEGINSSASANIANYVNLCAGYFAAQTNAFSTNNASSIITAIHAVVDRAATYTSSGRTWVAWIDTHQETKSGAGDYLVRLSHNGTVANDGAFTIYNGGRMPVLFNFEDAAGFLTETGDAGSTKAGFLAVQTPVGLKYIQLVTV